MNLYARQAIAFRNELRQSSAALLGIAQGMLADGELHDREIAFLQEWLQHNTTAAAAWPGNVLAAQIQHAIADGVITLEERAHLVDVLRRLVGGQLDELAHDRHVTELALDDVVGVEFAQHSFCFTGDFCFGTRSACVDAVQARGGIALPNVTRKLDYLVVGGLGSPEWKHGSFGTKIEKALQYRQAGVPLRVVHEDPWASSLMSV